MKEKNIIKFAENILNFKPTALQEAILNAKRLKVKPLWWGRKSYKKYFSNEFACSNLLNMKVGQIFGLAHPKGLFIFELKEIKK